MLTFLSVAHLLAATTSTTTKAKPSSGGSLLIFIIPLLVLAYLLIFRPQKQRARRQQQMQSSVEEGDLVATIGGIVGRVVAISGERATVEVAPGVEMEFLRQAIARKVDPVTTASADWEGEHGDDEDDAAPTEDAHDEDDRGWHGFHPEEVDGDGHGTSEEASPARADPAPAGGADPAPAGGADVVPGAPGGAGTAGGSPAAGMAEGDHLGRIYGAAPAPTNGAERPAGPDQEERVAPGDGGAPGEPRPE